MKTSDLFSIEYPKTLIYSEMKVDPWGINFVSSQGKDNGVVSKVARVDGVKIYPAGVITVPLKGTVLVAHLQPRPCYVAHQIAVFYPKEKMTIAERLFYCTCIRRNSFRFNYGRQADISLKDIELPDTVPDWAYTIPVEPVKTAVKQKKLPPLNISRWKEFQLDDLFTLHKGKRLRKEDMIEGKVNYLGAISENNGIRQQIDEKPIFESNCITVNYNGSVGEAFYQSSPFWASDDVNVLYAKGWALNKYIALFITTVIKANRYKFSYGRKWTSDKMKKSIIKLPITSQGTPDWNYMEQYIKSLPYSDRI